MTKLIAVKSVGKNRPGEHFRARAHEARVLIALGLAKAEVPAPVVKVEPPKPKIEPRKEVKATPYYQRRDMVAKKAEG